MVVIAHTYPAQGTSVAAVGAGNCQEHHIMTSQELEQNSETAPKAPTDSHGHDYD